MGIKQAATDEEDSNAYGLQAVRALALGLRRRLPMITQTHMGECGLACVAMIAGYYGRNVDLYDLRRSWPVSERGMTMAKLVDVASSLQLTSRAVSVDVGDVRGLRIPCILHWNLTHFVVLRAVRRNTFLIHDPALGERSVSKDQFSKSFSGIALELWPGQHFTAHAGDTKPVRFLSLIGSITGVWRSFAQLIALAFVLQILGLISPLFLQWVIDHALIAGDRDLLTTLALGFALLVIVTQAVSLLSSWASMYLSTSWSVQWSANVFTHLLKLPLSYFEKRHLGDIVSRFQSMNIIQTTLTSAFIRAVVDGVMVLFVVVLMFAYSPFLGIVSISAVTFYILCRALWYRPLRLATQEQIVRTAAQSTHFLETIHGARTIKLFRNQDIRRSTWLTLLVEQINHGLKVQKLQLFYTLVNGLSSGLVGILLIWLAARMVIDGELTAGMMMAYIAYQAQFSERIASLVDRFFEVKMLQVHGERLADIVFTEQEKHPAEGRSVSKETGHQESRIDIANLKFRYSERDVYILNGITLSIEPGECVAITGPSGCGKSTLLNVLLGVLPPTSGEVKFGGVSVVSLDPSALRSRIACVTQKDTLFAGTVAENISFFDKSADQQWIEECARMAAIDSEIETLPMGYNTFLGQMGSILSGGQQQRLLLARALYQRPKILILDEATSHLDVKREALVNAVVRDLNITRVIVAHRPQTIELADRVVTLDQGVVVSDRRTVREVRSGTGS